MARVVVDFHPAAAEEAIAAFDWYRTRSGVAAQAFRDALEQAVAAIEVSPHTWPRHRFETRRYLFAKFPFSLIYRVAGDTLTIVAVAHGRRRPGYWRGR